MSDVAARMNDLADESGPNEHGWYKDDKGRRLNVKERSPDGSKTHSQLTREGDEWRDSQPQTSWCAQPGCKWVFVGLSGPAREAFAEHLREAHPDVKPLTGKQRRARAERMKREEAAEKRAQLERAKVRPADAGSTTVTPGAGEGGATYSRRKRTRDEVLAAIREVAAVVGGTPSINDMRRHGKGVGWKTCTRMFGSWRAAVAAAGFEPNPKGGDQSRAISASLSRKTEGSVVSALAGEQPNVRPAATESGNEVGGTRMPPTDPAYRLAVEVLDELRTARTVFAAMHSPHEGFAVIKEELDELWEHVRGNTGRGRRARREAIQIAAMAMRYIIDLSDDEAAA